MSIIDEVEKAITENRPVYIKPNGEVLFDDDVPPLPKDEPSPFEASEMTPYNWEPMLKVVLKKPSIINAAQLNCPEGFSIMTGKGRIFGRPGDYIVFDVIAGDKWIITKEYFEQMYVILDD